MLNFNAYIRIVFSSMMLLPMIILGYFIVHFSERHDCLTLHFKHRPVLAAKPIAWPDNGLLTIWFDSDFFVKNKKKIMTLMNRYQFSGVISLFNGKTCRTQSLSLYQLVMLENQGWEISETNAFVDGEHAINDMPAPDRKKQAIYDLSHDGDEVSLTKYLKETRERNGWIILYFHTNNMDSSEKKPMSIAKLNHILQIVTHLGIPVVLQEQVLRVSQ